MAVSAQKIKLKAWPLLKDQRGVAVVEMLPLLAIFITVFGLAFGFWTSIHSGTLQSIAARRYAFEVINNRSDFVYHRDTKEAANYKQYFQKNGNRFFAVVQQQKNPEPKLQAEGKDLSLFNKKDPMSIEKVRQEGNKVSPIWLKTGYGICIDCKCGEVTCPKCDC